MNVVQGTLDQVAAGTLNPAYACQLTNDTVDLRGPGKSGVTVNCQFLDPALGGGTGTADVTNAVVNVTGP
jgi:hypothetical protein